MKQTCAAPTSITTHGLALEAQNKYGDTKFQGADDENAPVAAAAAATPAEEQSQLAKRNAAYNQASIAKKNLVCKHLPTWGPWNKKQQPVLLQIHVDIMACPVPEGKAPLPARLHSRIRPLRNQQELL